MGIQNEIRLLLEAVPRDPDEVIEPDVQEERLADFERRFHFVLPEEVTQWLHFCNGANVGPGGLFGISTTNEWLRIETYLEQHPEWVARKWLPVAGDGCGDYYVIDVSNPADNLHPVYFVDAERGYDVADYVVASGIWTFMRFLLRKELILTSWPFHKEEVLAEDPHLHLYQGPVPLAWETL